MSFKSFFSTLDNIFFQDQDSLDSESLYSLRSFINALFEGVYDKKVEANTDQEVEGHDHLKSAYSPYAGGAYLSHGQVYVGSNAGQVSGLFSGLVASSGVFYPADNANSNPRSSVPLPMVKGLVSAGWDTSGVGVPTVAPYLTAHALVSFTSNVINHNAQLRVDNASLAGRASQVSIFTPSATGDYQQWVQIDKIPCQSGENDFDLMVSSNQASTPIKIEALVILEECEKAPPSAGTEQIGRA